MKAAERRKAIEDKILAVGEVDFASLAAEYGVSAMTIRRDIEALESTGSVRRVWGGVIAASKAREPSFASRESGGTEGKTHIAFAAAGLLRRGETLILDGGSTALAVARAIRGHDLALTVLTPSIQVAVELVNEPDTTVLLTGGELRPGELSMIGTEAEEFFDRYNCDTYIMGVAGVDGERGLTEYHRAEGNLKRAAMRASDRVIVVVDAQKLGGVQLLRVASLADVSTIVTDARSDDATLVAARRLGVRVMCIDAEAQHAVAPTFTQM